MVKPNQFVLSFYQVIKLRKKISDKNSKVGVQYFNFIQNFEVNISPQSNKKNNNGKSKVQISRRSNVA
jgi:hypothetical protein